MKSLSVIAAIFSIIVMMACTITVPVTRMQTGETMILPINEPALPDLSRNIIAITMGAGKLMIGSGAAGLIEGSVSYNVPEWKPVVRKARQGETLNITQGTNFSNKLPPENVVNDWQLKLGQTPTDLTINAGAYNSILALGGIPLTNLTINDGASTAVISFTSPNPSRMQNLVYKTGASTVSLTGLGNANFANMSFESGAGTYNLDFSGELKQESDVHISSGVSSFTISVPSSTACNVILTGAMNSVKTKGSWTASNQTYLLQGKGPLLTITVELGVGSLELIAQ